MQFSGGHSLTFPFLPHEVSLVAWVFLLCHKMLSIGKCWQRELRVLCNGECETPRKACSMRETQGEMEAPSATLKGACLLSAFPLQPVLEQEGLIYWRLLEQIRANQNHSRMSLFCSLSFSVQHSLIQQIFLKDLHLGPQITDTDMNSYWKTGSLSVLPSVSNINDFMGMFESRGGRGQSHMG